MADQRTYESDAIRVRWDSSRCIHTGLCLRALPEVFDVRSRPWIDVEGAGTDAIAEAVERCPTGALSYERTDGSAGETPARPTHVIPIEDGPLEVSGDLDITTPDGEQISREARATLCRCGMSRNQPFCDNSHLRKAWRSGPTSEPRSQPPEPREGATDAPTRVTPGEDQSVELRGHIRVHHSDGSEMLDAGRVFLCRCGQSANKPFCDGSHEGAGFRSRDPELERDRLEAETPAAFTPNPRVPEPPGAGD